MNVIRKIKKNTSPTPLTKLNNSFLKKHNLSLYVKRIDLIHPYISGNKWYKLYYNLIEAKRQNKETLLTFGGAYSNHIYATAAAGNIFGFNTIGLIRGEEYKTLNPTLSFAKNNGMKLHYISRTNYRRRNDSDYIAEVYKKFGDVYLIPEGGTNSLALKGAAEIIDDININFDYVCSPCGTGGTLAGIVLGLNGMGKALGFSVLKGGSFLKNNIEKLIAESNGNALDNWSLFLDYHFGGYAKIHLKLIEFIKEFEKLNKIKLDPIYTGKMMYGVYDLISKGYFKSGTTIIVVHTGGLQGIEGMRNKINKLLT